MKTTGSVNYDFLLYNQTKYQKGDYKMEWYIAIDSQAKPIPEEVLIYKIKNKEIPSETLVVNEQIKNWVEIKNTDLWEKYALKDVEIYPHTQILDIEKNQQEKNYDSEKAMDTHRERCLGLAITGFVFALIGFFIFPIVFSVLGFIFGIIAAALNPSEDGDGFKPITKYKNKARGFGISALTGGAIGIVLMIFNMLRLGGYI